MNLVEQSFRNLVRFHADELRAINGGELASDVLSQHQREKLGQKGILRRASNHRRAVLTEEALKVLEDEE